MTHKNEEETVVDAQMHHPFRCLVAGPSQSGKSTFVCNLLLRQNDIIDICFDYVTIVLGTDANKNEILSSLKDELRPGVVEIIDARCAMLVFPLTICPRCALVWGTVVRGLHVEIFVRVLRSSRVNLNNVNNTNVFCCV